MIIFGKYKPKNKDSILNKLKNHIVISSFIYYDIFTMAEANVNGFFDFKFEMWKKKRNDFKGTKGEVLHEAVEYRFYLDVE